MVERTRGVVLGLVKCGDHTTVVDVYTASRGNVSFWVKQPAGRKGKAGQTRFAPLALVEIDFEYRPAASLQRMKVLQNFYTYSQMPYDPLKSAVALFLSEFLYKVLKNETPNEDLFSYIVNSLQWFDAAVSGYANFHLVFITRLTRFLGFYPNVGDYEAGDYFDMLNACFVSRQPMHAAFLRPDEAATIPLFMRMNYDSMRFFAMNRQQRNRYMQVLNDYYCLHVPDFPHLKSLDVLREVFD